MKTTLTILFVFISLSTFSQIVEEVEKREKKEVFESYELQEKPEFPGGDAALLKFVAENLKFPAIENVNPADKTDKKVYVRFIVTKTGDIGDAQILRSSGSDIFDIEALRVVKLIPKWKPGKIKGEPVGVWYIIPINFKLE